MYAMSTLELFSSHRISAVRTHHEMENALTRQINVHIKADAVTMHTVLEVMAGLTAGFIVRDASRVIKLTPRLSLYIT